MYIVLFIDQYLPVVQAMNVSSHLRHQQNAGIRIISIPAIVSATPKKKHDRQNHLTAVLTSVFDYDLIC